MGVRGPRQSTLVTALGSQGTGEPVHIDAWHGSVSIPFPEPRDPDAVRLEHRLGREPHQDVHRLFGRLDRLDSERVHAEPRGLQPVQVLRRRRLRRPADLARWLPRQLQEFAALLGDGREARRQRLRHARLPSGPAAGDALDAARRICSRTGRMSGCSSRSRRTARWARSGCICTTPTTPARRWSWASASATRCDRCGSWSFRRSSCVLTGWFDAMACRCGWAGQQIQKLIEAVVDTPGAVNVTLPDETQQQLVVHRLFDGAELRRDRTTVARIAQGESLQWL